TASHGPGPCPGHTGWPLYIVFSTITYEPVGTNSLYFSNSPSVRRFLAGCDPSTTTARGCDPTNSRTRCTVSGSADRPARYVILGCSGRSADPSTSMDST